MALFTKVLAAIALVALRATPSHGIKLNAKMRPTRTPHTSGTLFKKRIEDYTKVSGSDVPMALFKLTKEIIADTSSSGKLIDQEGILRLSADESWVNRAGLKNSVGAIVRDLHPGGTHGLPVVLKKWLRELQSPLIPIEVREYPNPENYGSWKTIKDLVEKKINE